MNFFKENNDKCQIVPSLPTGDSGIEPGQDGFKSVHPGVCPFHRPPFLIHLLVKKTVFRGIATVPSVRADVGYDAMAVKGHAEIIRVKHCVKVGEKIRMVSGLRLGHGKRKSVAVTQEEGVCGLPFLTALIRSLFPSSVDRGMRAVDMREREVHLILVPAEKLRERRPPFPGLAPFPVVMEDGVPARRLSSEKVSDRKHPLLAAALKLVQDRVHDLRQVEFCGESSFCHRKIGHNPIFYCIFVEYSVFWHGCNIFMFGDYNIVHFLRSALYFNFFTVLLTS